MRYTSCGAEVGPRNSKSLINHQRDVTQPGGGSGGLYTLLYIRNTLYMCIYIYVLLLFICTCFVYPIAHVSCPHADGFQLTGSTRNIRRPDSDYIILLLCIPRGRRVTAFFFFFFSLYTFDILGIHLYGTHVYRDTPHLMSEFIIRRITVPTWSILYMCFYRRKNRDVVRGKIHI